MGAIQEYEIFHRDWMRGISKTEYRRRMGGVSGFQEILPFTYLVEFQWFSDLHISLTWERNDKI